MSHLPVNHSSVSWRPPLDEGNRTTSSEESRHEILMPSKWKTMSIKITELMMKSSTGGVNIQWETRSHNGYPEIDIPCSNGTDTSYS